MSRAKRHYPRFVPVALTIAVCAGVLPAQNKPSSTADLVRDADEARKRGDLTRAVTLFTTAQKSKDFNAAKAPVPLILAVGDFYFAQSSADAQTQALATYDLAFSIHGNALPAFDVAQVRVRRSEVLSWQGKLDLARDEINALRSAYKNDRRVNLLADLASANILLLSNQAQAARDALAPLVEINDPIITPQAMFALGRAYVQLKQPEQAVATFRSLWNRYGESDFVKRAVYLIGQVYFDRGDFLEARKLYEACAVVGASMQTTVRVGDELIVKVSDPDYYARTRSQVLPVSVTVPSGDQESIRLEKNQVSDQLYIGRIQTALLLPKPGDSQLQVAGNDVISISYAGQAGKAYEVRVVDDAAVQIDSVELPVPAPRHERALPKPERVPARQPDAEPIVIPTGKLTAGSVAPGSPVYLQVVDADLDVSAEPDRASVELVATLNGQTADKVAVTLTETGPRTGVFTGTAPTEPVAADATVSGALKDHPAHHAIDDDPKTFWKAPPGALKDGKKHFIEVNLRRPSELASLTWGPGEAGMSGAPTAMRVILRGENTDVTIPVSGKPNPTDNRIDLRETFARTVRIEIDAHEGDSPAIGQLIITDSLGGRLVPTGIDPAAPERATHLAFDVGHQVFASFVDEENDTPGRKVTRESRKLGVRYHDAQFSIASATGEGEARRMSPAWRIDRNGQQWVVVNDPDRDTTTKKDQLTLKVFTEIGDSQELVAEETGDATGVFAAVLPLASVKVAMDNPRLLRVGEGDLLWMSYDDDRNMKPGYRTFRRSWVLENRPTVGDFASASLVTTAWPFEVKPTADGEMQVAAREIGKGRVIVEYADPDAFADGTRSVTPRLNTLIGGTVADITMLPTAPGRAAKAIDLVLGDIDTARQVAAGNEGPRNELNVVGDDLIRIAVTDTDMASSSLAIRPVLGAEALEAMLGAADDPTKDVLPRIKLSDPIRRMQQEQSQRQDALRAEMGERLLAYRLTIEELKAFRAPIERRIAALKDNAEQIEPLKRQLAAVDAQVELHNARIERLKALGAVEAKALREAEPTVDAAPAPVDPKLAVVDGPVIPGRAFEVVIDDPDLKDDKLSLRVRSVAGQLVDSLTVEARRQPDGTYLARIDTERSSDRADQSRLSLLPGGEVIADYDDHTAIPDSLAERVQYLALSSDATVRSLNSNYVDEVSQIRLGQDVYVEVVDYDADRSSALDLLLVTVRARSGDELRVLLSETEPHSGVFRGAFKTGDGNPVKDDDVLQASYGGEIEIAYADLLRTSASEPIRKTASLHVTGGSDGTIDAFSRQFRDSREEMELWFRTGQAAYHVGRKLYLAGSVARAEEYLVESSEYFRALVTRFPDDPFAASSNYYLGNIESLRGRHREALTHFQDVITRFPKSEFVPQARFKLGQAYEGLGQFDQATDAYVLLTYHHPDDVHVPLSMIRMMNHSARSEHWADAVAIAQRFVVKFPAHDQAGAVALKAGQWLTVSGKTDEALAWYTSAEKTFATSDRDMPALLYWHAATMIQGGQVGDRGPRADKIRELLNRVVFDYPRSEYSALARIALEQINQQN